MRQRNNVGDQYWWRCTKCLRFTTVRWALQHVQNDICQSVEISKQTLTSFFQEIRLVVVNDFKRGELILGGAGMEVQIDESIFLRVKHNRGKDLKREQMCVFGMTDVEKDFVLFFQVPSRDAVTLT